MMKCHDENNENENWNTRITQFMKNCTWLLLEYCKNTQNDRMQYETRMIQFVVYM